MARGKKKKLADGEIVKLMHIYDDDMAFEVADHANEDLYFVDNLLYCEELLTANHIRHLERIRDTYDEFEEFKDLFSHVCFAIPDTLMIAPEEMEVDWHVYPYGVPVPDEVKAQLKPVTRDDVLNLAEKLRDAISDLYGRFDNHICYWMDEEGVEDYNSYLGVDCFESLIDGAFYKYMDEFWRYRIPEDWDLLDYLLARWKDEDRSNYQAIVDKYLKDVKTFNQLTKDYNDASFELEELIFEQFKWQVEDEVQQDKLIDKKAKAVLEFHRNHTFNFNK